MPKALIRRCADASTNNPRVPIDEPWKAMRGHSSHCLAPGKFVFPIHPHCHTATVHLCLPATLQLHQSTTPSIHSSNRVSLGQLLQKSHLKSHRAHFTCSVSSANCPGDSGCTCISCKCSLAIAHSLTFHCFS